MSLFGRPAKSGVDLLKEIDGAIETARKLLSIDIKPEDRPATDGIARRRFGKHLDPVTGATITMIDTGNGIYDSLSFGSGDVRADRSAIEDLGATEIRLKRFLKDVHAARVFVTGRLAGNVSVAIDTNVHTASNPGLDQKTRDLARSTGQHVQDILNGRKASAKKRRNATGALRDEVGTANAKVQQLQNEKTVSDATKDVKISYLSGEPLRPEDVVITATPSTTPATATPAAGGTRRPRGTTTTATTGTGRRRHSKR